MELSIAWFVTWAVAVSLVAMLMTMWDKNRARRREWRVSESTLWLAALVGGAAAMFVTMFAIRHKTQHRSFMIGLPLLAAVQIIGVALLYRFGYLVLT